MKFCKGLLWLKKLFKSKVIFSLLWWQSASVGKKMCRQVKIVKWNYKSISRYIFHCTFFAKFSTLYRSRPIERPTTIISQSPSKRRRYLSQTINQDSSVCCYLGYVIFWILEQFHGFQQHWNQLRCSLFLLSPDISALKSEKNWD